MTREYFDSQGAPLNPDLIGTPEKNEIVWSPESEAEYAASQEQMIEVARRFDELADENYWRCIEMEKGARLVLRDEKGAREWADLAVRIRARLYAQILEEMNNDG